MVIGRSQEEWYKEVGVNFKGEGILDSWWDNKGLEVAIRNQKASLFCWSMRQKTDGNGFHLNFYYFLTETSFPPHVYQTWRNLAVPYSSLSFWASCLSKDWDRRGMDLDFKMTFFPWDVDPYIQATPSLCNWLLSGVEALRSLIIF